MSLGRAAPAVNARSAVDRMWSRRTVAGAEDRHTQRRHRIVCTLHAGGSGADTRTCARLYRGGVVYDGPRPRPQSSETETSHSHEVFGRRRH